MKYIMGNRIPYDKITSHNEQIDLALIGGKALGLWRYADLFCPKWFVITTEFFDEIYELDKNLLNDLILKEDYDQIEQVIMLKKYDQKYERMILKRINKDKLYAVRSSAVDEDNQNNSFAGIMESYLNVKYETIITYIKRCFLSAFSKKAINYRMANNLDKFNIKMAVIVQEMVDADFAGVANTINPITNNPDEFLISVVEGLGETLVSGKSASCDYFVNGSKIKCHSEQSLIDDKIIKKIMKLCYQVINRVNTFQDIEFAVKKNKVYFLQARTIVPYKDINILEPKTTLDNANIVESYSGVTTPLTFSFAKEVYQKVYTTTLQEGKVNEKVINDLTPYLKDMLRFYDSKIYYNLNSWYRLTSIFPGSNNNLNYMENMMGVKTKMTKVKKVKISLFASLKLGLILLHRLKKMPTLSKEFLITFDNVVMPYYQKDFRNFSNEELLKIYEQIETHILNGFTTPIINDVGAMMYYGKLTKYVNNLPIVDKDGFISNKVSKQGDVASAESAPLYLKILDVITSKKEIKDDFISLEPSALYQKYHNNSALSESINNYIERFGPRVMNELKLETITLLEDPIFLYQMLKNSIVNNIHVSTNLNNNQPLDVKLPLFKQIKLNKLVKKTKYFIKNRELLRLRRTYLYSVIRRIFLRIGQNFCDEKIIKQPRDIFFLKKEEITMIINGEASKLRNSEQVIETRKAKMQSDELKETYERIVFFGNAELHVLNQKSKDGILRGIPSGAGVVKGKVKLVTNPQSAIINDEIILAERTDPGWVMLFPMCKGLIVERGSILSHSAVVAREMGIPAVVGIKDATKIIHDGDYVTLDGIKGEIIIHEE